MANPINIRGKNEVEWKHSTNHRVDLKDHSKKFHFLPLFLLLMATLVMAMMMFPPSFSLQCLLRSFVM
jgi:hypothetical protein